MLNTAGRVKKWKMKFLIGYLPSRRRIRMKAWPLQRAVILQERVLPNRRVDPARVAVLHSWTNGWLNAADPCNSKEGYNQDSLPRRNPRSKERVRLPMAIDHQSEPIILKKEDAWHQTNLKTLIWTSRTRGGSTHPPAKLHHNPRHKTRRQLRVNNPNPSRLTSSKGVADNPCLELARILTTPRMYIRLIPHQIQAPKTKATPLPMSGPLSLPKAITIIKPAKPY